MPRRHARTRPDAWWSAACLRRLAAALLAALVAFGLPACAGSPEPLPDPGRQALDEAPGKAGDEAHSEEAGEAPAGGELKIIGRLTDEGVECPALRGDDGELYTLTGGTGGFAPGDRVEVVATPVQISFCMQGTTVKVRQIQAAPGG